MIKIVKYITLLLSFISISNNNLTSMEMVQQESIILNCPHEIIFHIFSIIAQDEMSQSTDIISFYNNEENLIKKINQLCLTCSIFNNILKDDSFQNIIKNIVDNKLKILLASYKDSTKEELNQKLLNLLEKSSDNNPNLFHEAIELIISGAYVNTENHIGETTLTKLIISSIYGQNKINNKETIAKILIKNKANINTEKPNWGPILIIALNNNEIELAKILIESGADFNTKDYIEDSAIIIACKKGMEEIFNLLLSKNVNIETKDRHGHTGLVWAVLQGHKNIVKTLLDKKAKTNFNINGSSLIDLCKRFGPEYKIIAEMLLDYNNIMFNKNIIYYLGKINRANK